MSSKLGPRDEQRFAGMEPQEREYLAFLIDLCFRVLRKRPEQPEALDRAASALTALGYYETGLALDRRLATLRPDSQLVLYNLACSLALTGQADEAMDALRRAIELGYEDVAHMLQDEDLVSLHGDARFTRLLERLGTEVQ